ncbi:MAG: DoxX family protein [Polyangiaceae bacterium]
MNIKQVFAPPALPLRSDIGLLVVRVAVGAALMVHGFPKIQNPMAWMGADGPPSVLQLIAAVSEFVGGLGLVTGFLTPVACIGIVATMGYAAYTHASKGDPWIGKGGPSYELAGIYLAGALACLVAGPGRLSLDRAVFGKGRAE